MNQIAVMDFIIDGCLIIAMIMIGIYCLIQLYGMLFGD